jgi:hypothetical protein
MNDRQLRMLPVSFSRDLRRLDVAPVRRSNTGKKEGERRVTGSTLCLFGPRQPAPFLASRFPSRAKLRPTIEARGSTPRSIAGLSSEVPTLHFWPYLKNAVDDDRFDLSVRPRLEHGCEGAHPGRREGRGLCTTVPEHLETCRGHKQVLKGTQKDILKHAAHKGRGIGRIMANLILGRHLARLW